MSVSKNKIVVTGANGFVGSQLCKYLHSKNQNVVAYCRRESTELQVLQPNIELVLGDLFDSVQLKKACRGADCIFHLAALARPWAPDYSQFYDVNVVGTQNVLNAARSSGVRRFVFTSTAGVFAGGSTSMRSVNETFDVSPFGKTAYEKSKIEAEALVKDFGKRFDVDVVIVNPTRIFGPGPIRTSNFITKLISNITQSRRLFLPNLRSTGNYVFIKDVVVGHWLAYQHGRSGENYLLGGENVSFIQLAELIRTCSAESCRFIKIPPWIILALSYLEWVKNLLFGVPPKLTPEFAKKYLKDVFVDSKKAIDELGYSPVSLRDGVESTIQWLKDSQTAS